MISKLEKRLVAICLAFFVVLAGFPCGTISSKAADRENIREIVQGVVSEEEIAAGESVLYSFIPAVTATYSVTTIGERDTVGHVYDADFCELYADNDGGEGLNYEILAELTAGETYYVESAFFQDGDAGVIATSINEALVEETQAAAEEETAAAEEETVAAEEKVAETAAADEETELVEEQTATDSDVKKEEQEDADLSNTDFEYDVIDGEVIIADYIGTDKEVVIPEQIDDMDVIAIGARAFDENGVEEGTGITSVSIPDTVTEIQYAAFAACKSLKNVTFSTAGNLKTIGQEAFRDCGITTINLPEGLETIEDAAFTNSDIQTLTMPDTVTSMGYKVCSECTFLENVTLSKSLTSIPAATFYYTEALTTLVIPDNIVEIGEYAFAYSGLTILNLPENLRTIDEYAFMQSNVGEVSFPDSLSYLGDSAFYKCENLVSVKFGNGLWTIGKETFSYTNIQDIDYGNVRVIGEEAFSFGGITSLTLPYSVSEIQYCAYYGNENLTSISIEPYALTNLDGGAFHKTKWYANQPEGVTYISDAAYHYKGIAEGAVTIKDGTRLIAAGAFSGQNQMTSVKLPESLMYINTCAFLDCDGLKEIEIPDSVWTIGDYAIGYTTNSAWFEQSLNYELPEKVKVDDFTIIGKPGSVAEIYAEENGFTFKSNVLESDGFQYKIVDNKVKITGYTGMKTDVTIPSKLDGKDVTEIGAYAFYNTDIERVTIPDSVTTLGEWSFDWCASLKTVVLGKGIKTIPNGAFCACPIESINLDNIQSIGESAFSSGAKFTNLNIPSSVTEIQYGAFHYNQSLASVTIPSNLLKLGGYAFSDTPWYVNQTDGMVYLGQIMYGYKGIAGSSVTVKNGTKSIAESAFLEQKNITSVNLPDGLSYINKYAFLGCSGLKSITIPASVTTIDDYALGYIHGGNISVPDWNYIFYDLKKQPGFTIIGEPGSAAERYAKTNGFTFKSIGLPEVTNVKAVPAGKNKVKLTWSKQTGADGYLIYASKNGKYAKCGMTSTTSFTDTKALDEAYNFYFVYAYKKTETGKIVVSEKATYKYAKGICPSVSNLKAYSQKGGVKLTWTKQADAAGYMIYGKTKDGKFHKIAVTVSNTYIDKKASKTEYNFYWVTPYHKTASGKVIAGYTAPYVYGKAK